MDDEQREKMARTGEHPTWPQWEDEDAGGADDEDDKVEDVRDMIFLGKIPIMVKSTFCHLYGEDDESLFLLERVPLRPGWIFHHQRQ